MTASLVGWSSAVLLVLTIAAQILRQWRARTSAGVSPLLYIGQFGASSGLTAYSVMLDDLVFIILNIIMASAALLGLGSWFRFRRADRRAS